MIDICLYYSHRFDFNKHIFLSPLAAVGGAFIQEVSDSIYTDTSGLPYTAAYPDTIENRHKTVFHDLALQAGFDLNFREN